MAPRPPNVSRAPLLLALGWVLIAGGDCAHRHDEDTAKSRAESRRMLAADFDAHLAELTAFAKSIPPCAAGQHGIEVEQFLERQLTPGDCYLVRGELLFDSEPVRGCRSKENPDGPACMAYWALAGSERPTRAQVLPGSRAVQADAHTLILYNDLRFDKPKRLCETAGGVRLMPQGRLFRFPDAYRERIRPPTAAPMPKVSVVILGEISNFQMLDVSAICRTDGLSGAPAPAR